MRPKRRAGHRLVAWACVLLLVFAALAPVAAGGVDAVLVPAALVFGPSVVAGIRSTPQPSPPPGRIVPATVPARAPPLA